MQMPLHLVSTIGRLCWIKDRWDPKEVIYMGDGIFDHLVFQAAGYAIAPTDADENAKKAADFVTNRAAGKRAVAEACLHILKKFFGPYNLTSLLRRQIFSGEAQKP